jgi:hypothetical protein
LLPILDYASSHHPLARAVYTPIQLSKHKQHPTSQEYIIQVQDPKHKQIGNIIQTSEQRKDRTKKAEEKERREEDAEPM